jgi:hypothetical protein
MYIHTCMVYEKYVPGILYVGAITNKNKKLTSVHLSTTHTKNLRLGSKGNTFRISTKGSLLTFNKDASQVLKIQGIHV